MSDPQQASGVEGHDGSLMISKFLGYGLQYAGYLIEAGLLVFLLRDGRWKRALGPLLFLAWLLTIDGLARPFVLYWYGLGSPEYRYFYWLTDIVLSLAAFLLVCAFFRRACAREEKMWRSLRTFLTFVFVLVVGVSSLSLSHNYSRLFPFFIIEFEQNLYFTCLVLNTLVFILMQQLQSNDEELALLVCGMGLQFAGPAAGWALVHLTPNEHFGQSIQNYIMPLCTLGMLMTWFHAFARAPEAPAVAGGKVSHAEEVAASKL